MTTDSLAQPSSLSSGRTSLAQLGDRLAESRVGVLLLFALHFLLTYPSIFPRFYQIDQMNVPHYSNNGRVLMAGLSEGRFDLTPLAGNPLVSLMYAIPYMFVRDHPSWMLLVEWCVRLFLFTLTWVSGYLIVRQLPGLFRPLLFFALILTLPTFFTLLSEAPYASFACMSALAFWQLLKFYNTGRIRHVVIGSAFVALAEFSRSDGLFLIPIFVALSTVVAFKNDQLGASRLMRAGRTALLALLPFAFIVGGYLVLYGVLVGVFQTGSEGRVYAVFEQSEGVIYAPTSMKAWTDAFPNARALYGTPEENHYSVPSAILHNPKAFGRRLLQLVGTMLPTVMLQSYGGVFGATVLFLAGAGVVQLVRRKQHMTALMLAAWPCFLLVYLAFFYKDAYVLMPYYIVLILAAVALTTARDWVFKPVAAGAALVTATFTVVLGNVIGVLPIVVTGMVLGLVFGALFFGGRLMKDPGPLLKGMLAVAGACVLVLRLLFFQPQTFGIGDSGEEQTAVYLASHFDRNARIAAATPAVVWDAKMSWERILEVEEPIDTPERLAAWLKSSGVKAILLDDLFQSSSPDLYNVISREVGKGLQIAYTYTDRSEVRAQLTAGFAAAVGMTNEPTFRVVVPTAG